MVCEVRYDTMHSLLFQTLSPLEWRWLKQWAEAFSKVNSGSWIMDVTSYCKDWWFQLNDSGSRNVITKISIVKTELFFKFLASNTQTDTKNNLGVSEPCLKIEFIFNTNFSLKIKSKSKFCACVFTRILFPESYFDFSCSPE